MKEDAVRDEMTNMISNKEIEYEEKVDKGIPVYCDKDEYIASAIITALPSMGYCKLGDVDALKKQVKEIDNILKINPQKDVLTIH